MTLLDENPVPPSLIGMDIPLLFGGRATAAVQNPARMLEQVLAASPDLATAFDLGVDVRLGTCAWGAWRPGPALTALPGPVVGLADAERSWLCGFSELVIAAGARDLVLGFAGAELPGVVGAQALHALLVRYGAFAGRRLVVLGGGPFGLATAALALDHGCEVAAVVEARDALQAPDAPRARLSGAGVELLDAHTILAAEGGADGVAAAVVLDASGARRRIACDTICLAVGRVPNVELLDVLGAKLVWRPERGGHVPEMETPLPACARSATAPASRPTPLTRSTGCAGCWRRAARRPPRACAKKSPAASCSACARRAISARRRRAWPGAIFCVLRRTGR